MSTGGSDARLSWLSIVRIGLVQTAIGALVVLTTSTLNRVMVIEISLPALVPGLLVAPPRSCPCTWPRASSRPSWPSP